jgi:hypothetical protein
MLQRTWEIYLSVLACVYVPHFPKRKFLEKIRKKIKKIRKIYYDPHVPSAPSVMVDTPQKCCSRYADLFRHILK